MTNSADPDQLADLDLHCLLRQGMACSAREGLKNSLLIVCVCLWVFSEAMTLTSAFYLCFVLAACTNTNNVILGSGRTG